MRKRSHLYIQKKKNLKNYFSSIFSIVFLFIVLNSYAQSKYEFRGVWVATLTNIDWPSQKYLSTEVQRSEFIKLLDMHQRNGMNAVIVQIRPATDAFYPSQYEPWSEWLTGLQGKPPIPFYDPLDFMITETHNRGMEFHAWMNPYRAELNVGRSSISPTHITKLHPDWFLTYGSLRIFDPGNKEVQDYVTNIVRDVVARYDVDAIHFDDYFYPYPIAGRQFPDTATFNQYGNLLSRGDWRRSNVDSIIIKLSKAIKQENKFCKFGISPFGVWRSTDRDAEGSNTRGALTNYDDLYADILLWLKNKWIDYVAPQLYWESSHRTAPFGLLTDWWAKHSYGRHLYIGHGIYRAFEGQAAWRNAKELPNQIKRIREYPQVHGSVYYSSKIFNRNPNGWNDTLQNNYYKYPAIVPPMPWIDSSKPAMPVLNIKLAAVNYPGQINLDVTNVTQRSVKQYAFYLSQNADLSNAVLVKLIPSAKDIALSIPLNIIPVEWNNNFYVFATAVSKTNNESRMSKPFNLSFKQDQWQISLL